MTKTSGYYSAVKLGADNRPSNGTELIRGTLAEVEPYWKPGKVVICWNYDAPEPRRLSQESLATVRRKRLVRRMSRKFPLFAARLVQDELAARPAYYAGER